jgi:hypothetical protein
MLEAGSMSVFADFINLQNCPEFGKVWQISKPMHPESFPPRKGLGFGFLQMRQSQKALIVVPWKQHSQKLKKNISLVQKLGLYTTVSVVVVLSEFDKCTISLASNDICTSSSFVYNFVSAEWRIIFIW